MNGTPVPAFKKPDPEATRQAEAHLEDCRKYNHGAFPDRPTVRSYLGNKHPLARVMEHLVL